MSDLWTASREAIAEARQATDDMPRLIIAAAEAERDYQVAKAARALELRAAGKSATEVGMIVKGDPKVSGAMFARDCAQGMVEANREKINTAKLDARMLDAQMAREWSRAGEDWQ